MHLKKLLLTIPLTAIILLTSVLSGYGAGKFPSIKILGQNINFSRDIMIENNRILVPGNDFINAIGGTVTYFKPDRGITLRKDSTTVRLYFNKSYINFKGEKIPIDTYPQVVDGMAMVPIRVLSNIFNLGVGWDSRNSTVNVFNRSQTSTIASSNVSRGTADTTSSIRKNGYKIVVDPGHGGSEPGAIVNGIFEKNLNLEISKIVATLLEEKGFKVYMTRTTDKTVGLYERTDLANSINADLLLSIHNNAGYLKDSGTMTLIHPNYDRFSPNNTIKIASLVQKEMVKTLGSKDLGLINRPNLAVLRTSEMPSILVEIGYMTNKTEMSKLLTKSYQNKAANAIVNGVVKAFTD